MKVSDRGTKTDKARHAAQVIRLELSVSISIPAPRRLNSPPSTADDPGARQHGSSDHGSCARDASNDSGSNRPVVRGGHDGPPHAIRRGGPRRSVLRSRDDRRRAPGVRGRGAFSRGRLGWGRVPRLHRLGRVRHAIGHLLHEVLRRPDMVRPGPCEQRCGRRVPVGTGPRARFGERDLHRLDGHEEREQRRVLLEVHERRLELLCERPRERRHDEWPIRAGSRDGPGEPAPRPCGVDRHSDCGLRSGHLLRELDGRRAELQPEQPRQQRRGRSRTRRACNRGRTERGRLRSLARSTGWDIYGSSWTDGLTWSANVKVNDDSLPNVFQFSPSVGIDAAGNVFAAWLDGRVSGQDIFASVLDVISPSANAGAAVSVGQGATVSFDGSGSSDNLGIAGYAWDYGDGSSGTGVSASHGYPTAGTYRATLTVW